MDKSGAVMVTYISGLHSPPVSQPTAIHQDIQLREEEEGDRLLEPLGGVARLRPASHTRDPHGTGDPREPRQNTKRKKNLDPNS